MVVKNLVRLFPEFYSGWQETTTVPRSKFFYTLSSCHAPCSWCALEAHTHARLLYLAREYTTKPRNDSAKKIRGIYMQQDWG